MPAPSLAAVHDRSAAGGRPPKPSSGVVRPLFGALGAGLCLALSMPPWGWWPLTFVGFAGLVRLVEGRRAIARFRRGWLVGISWFVPAMFWMLDFSIPGYLFAAVVLAAGLGVAVAVVPARAPWDAVALPGAVALVEWARWSFPFGGVPLATVPMAQVGSPLGPIARVGGGVALTMAAVAVGVALDAAVRRRVATATAALAAVVALAALAAVAPRGETVGDLQVALVQGGGPQRTRAVSSDADAVTARHLEATEAVTGPVDLVLWPENVITTTGPFAGSRQAAAVAEAARRLDTVVVAGIVESFPDHFRNASVVVGPSGRISDRYDKVLRVPFGEYIPWRGLVDSLSGGMASTLVPRDARAGTGPATLDLPSGRVGVVISWEVFFERRGRDAIERGGEVLLNPTNGSSYWLTIVQSQQIASSRLQALTTGRWVLQTAPTGFSAVVDPSGAVLQRTGVSEQRVLQATIERRRGATWATRWGPWPAGAAAAALVLAAQAGAVRCGGRRRGAGIGRWGPFRPRP